ncbi:PRC-barrel domain-containing protein [Roseinatronobacter sp. S2]|uniref:PRC-barrel domain-containing protein n=1 Tax=Roseinatronobacter sp. S2 TaxID=3035471 RepID=UPI0024102DAD|nr:PRC-barrel domain-containing protein [Roseinatronobacter sp. S2]WFE76553.1 PRC-barrel domain-containing protein [Roseinatronobacter sp. S2]
MKRLITTTALALIMAGPAVAQTTEGQQDGTQAGQPDAQSGLDGVHQGAMQHGDLLASELMDAQIFAPAQGQQQGQQDQQGLQDQQGQFGSRWAEPMGAEQLEGMENIGTVNDLLLDEQGSVQAVLVDVGGFLGMGARQVAIGLDQVSFVTDPDDATQVSIVTTMGADTLEDAPEFDQTAQQDRGMQQDGVQQEGTLQDDASQQDMQQQDAQQQDEWRGDRESLMAPDIQRDGYQQAQANEISADDLLDANLYDVNDNNVGNVTDVVLGPEGEAQYIVADVGGFLGLGAHTVAIGFDELSVMHDEGMADLRIYVDVTEDTLSTMPEYGGN